MTVAIHAAAKPVKKAITSTAECRLGVSVTAKALRVITVTITRPKQLWKEATMTECDSIPLVTAPDNTWCEKHLDRAGKARIPYADLMIALFDVMFADEELIRACGGTPEEGVLANSNMLNSELTNRAPLCCYLDSRGLLDNVYLVATPAPPGNN